jgi:hypothetical protein
VLGVAAAASIVWKFFKRTPKEAPQLAPGMVSLEKTELEPEKVDLSK